MGTSTLIDIPTAEDEEKKIFDQLRDFDEDIRQILAQRITLLRRLNHIHQIFPYEILCAIFECACTTDENDNLLLSPLILGAVCFRWRQIVLSSPSLWRTIGIIPKPRRRLRHSDVELLRLHFQNAGTHCVSLKFHFGSLPPGRTTEELIQVFADNSAKIQCLTVSGTNTLETWTKLAAAVRGCSFDHLHTLSFVGRNPIYPWFPQLSFQAPRLRSVSFVGLYISPREFSFHSVQVRILHLKHVAVGQCLEILAQALALQEFYCSETIPKERQTIFNDDPCTLHHLEIFDIDLGPSFKRWETFFFTHFRFPKLRKLVWGTSSPLSLEESDTTWRPFFSAMNFVGDFTYQSQEFSERELSGILQGLGPSVRRIRVSSPGADLKWQSVLNAIQLSMGRTPGYSNMWHIELFFPQQHPIFEQNQEEIKERLRRVGLEIDIIGFWLESDGVI